MSTWKEFLNENNIINEASEIKFKELSKDAQDFIKNNKLQNNADQYFDGIHGNIAQLTDVRLEKSDLKKLINDKNFRWVDASAIGF